MSRTLVVSVAMGYGHLRAAHPLAEALGTDVLHADRPPLADEREQRAWARTRSLYEQVSRLSQTPVVGAPFRAVLDTITRIPPLYPERDLSASTRGSREHERLITRHQLGRRLAERLETHGEQLLTTFYTPAIAVDRFGSSPVFCVVTDTDIHRVWAPAAPAETRITYLVPTERAGRRLRAYGVPANRIHFTGFPLPPRLLGGPDLPALRQNLAARLVRLDPAGAFRSRAGGAVEQALGPLPPGEQGRPPLVLFAVGGAGAQADLAIRFLPNLRPLIERGELRLALVAGCRREVEGRFREALGRTGLSTAVEVLCADDFSSYLARFNALLETADMLWTKPSELVFYAALGLPILISDPVGAHEHYNRRWLVEHGAGICQQDMWHVGEWLADGTLAAAAWAGYLHLPKRGLYEILDAVGGTG